MNTAAHSSTDELARDAGLDWEQLGLPVAVITADGHVQRANRAFSMLLRSSASSESTSLDWLARFTPEARITLFTALADRRSQVSPLAWHGARGPQLRWFSVTLKWRSSGARCVASFHDVTLLQHAEQQAREQVELLRSMANAAPALLASFDAHSRCCQYANRPLAQAFGLDENLVVGRTLGSLLGPEIEGEIQPCIEQLLRTRSSTELELALPTRDGQRRWHRLTLAPQFNAHGDVSSLYLRLRDQSGPHELERAVARSEERLSRFMEAATEGILFHEEGRITDANPAACLLLELARHELVGRPLPSLLPESLQARFEQAWSHQPEFRCEAQQTRADGSTSTLQWLTVAEHVDSVARAGGTTLVRDVSERHAAQARIHFLSHHDGLTGLPNRQAFMAQLEHLMVAAQAAQTQLGLLFIDLDHFQRVNDSLGHTAGDIHLKTIARRIGEQVRSTDRVARFGGDEFMVLLPGIRDARDAVQVAHKLIAAISNPIDIEGRPISVTPSIGLSIYPRDGDTPDMVIKHADTAMHVAKGRGRATLAEFEPAIAEMARAQLVLEGQLGHAIEHSEFELLLQPQVRASDGQPVGMEALIRWQHPERGLLAPDEFIALAEQHRLMLPIGDWVLSESAHLAQRWHTERPDLALSVAVNLSAMQFQAPDFLTKIETLLQHAALPRGWLELELTERMLMDDLPFTLARLHRLRELGVRLSVDDFGTGYSSLAQLKSLPIDKMKIDRSFVQGLPADRASAAIAKSIIELARGLGLGVVAEGVETLAQRALLTQLGCDAFQGLQVSAPIDAAALSAWLAGFPPAERPSPTP
jgi:diguanylate cyclase (GGDEF)-like protein/PAS domain S-box-containing protein